MSLAVAISSCLFTIVTLGVAILAVWAVLDCLRGPAANFPAMGKLTKGAWTGITGIAAVVAVFSFWFALQAMLISFTAVANGGVYGSAGIGIFTLAAAVAAGVYLADVRPAVSGKGNSGY